MKTIHPINVDPQIFGLVLGKRWGWLPISKEGHDFHVGDLIQLYENPDDNGIFKNRSIYLKVEKIFDDSQVCKDGTVVIVFKRIYFTLFLPK